MRVSADRNTVARLRRELRELSERLAGDPPPTPRGNLQTLWLGELARLGVTLEATARTRS